MVLLRGVFEPVRTQGHQRRHISKVIKNGYSGNSIVEKLLVWTKYLRAVVEMSGSRLKSLSIDVDTKFVFYKWLIGVEGFEVIRLFLFFILFDDFPDYSFGFAFSLNER